MKKIISAILTFTILASITNISFAEEKIFTYDIMEIESPSSIIFEDINDESIQLMEYDADFTIEDDASNKKRAFVKLKNSSSEEEMELFSTDYTFDTDLITSFNTVTGPVMGNGANEPKFSYNRFLEEKISDYSGALTLNFDDLVLEGRNGLNLNIGRTYQSVASWMGDVSLAVLPDNNGNIQNMLVSNYSTYLLDRYNLGVGWGFSFPSVQIETEYIPQESGSTFKYDIEKELYYHSGNGDVYRVRFTADTTDSNLVGYYGKDIQFNANDSSYSNGQVSSHYSMTLADKTKQYFAEDGRLIGIVDRFGNTIKFEHELMSIVNRIPEGNFQLDSDMWITSATSSGSADAIQVTNDEIGSIDGCVMRFRRNNAYIMSRPIQIKPSVYYDFGMRFKKENGRDIEVEIIGYDTAYNVKDTRTISIIDYDTEDWVDFKKQFAMSSAVRYIQIKISPKDASGTYIDNVRLDEPKPILKKITDTIGRTVEFAYQGNITGGETAGTVTLTVNSPDGASEKTLTYTKEAISFETQYLEHSEHRLYWYLSSSATEGNDGTAVLYTYEDGVEVESDGTLVYPPLYLSYNSKTYNASHFLTNQPVLNCVLYKDRKKMYEYETVRKHLGEDGYYDTLRIKKKYDMYGYVPEGSTKVSFKGELGVVNYSYEGDYNGNSFNNETGYPNYSFNDKTNLNEYWSVTKTGQRTETVTFSNCAVVQQTSSDGNVTVTSDFTNHSVFKNSPIEIKNTVEQAGDSRQTYLLYSYNDWGGIETESREITESIKNDSQLLEKYTTTYEYTPNYHFITKKSYYNNIDSQQIHETNTYDEDGKLLESENAAGEKINYYYENDEYSFLLTKTVQNDPMGLHNLEESDRIVTYAYDDYALFPVTVSENYNGSTASTLYKYDYISGNILEEKLPDNSLIRYIYYSDGRVKQVAYPYMYYTNGRAFYTIEAHTYKTYIIPPDYSDENENYELEVIRYYRVFTGETTTELYAVEQNLYDATGNLKMNIQYDASRISEEGYIGHITKYYHDSYDRLNKTVDAEGNTVLYSYDGFDRPVNATDSEGNVYSYSYNVVENKVDITLDGINNSEEQMLITQYFDLNGNTIRNVVYPENTQSQTLEESYEYDLNNNLVSYTDANGNETQYSYDAANRLIQTVLPNGVKAASSYNAFGKPVFEKVYAADGTEKSARISYRNEKGDLRAKFFTYDRHMVDTDIYSADARGRIIQVNEGENPKTVTYDQFNNPLILSSGDSQIHRRYNYFGEIWSAATDESITEVFMQYDAFGNISGKLQNNSYPMYYAHSASGKITQSMMPSERVESYTYTPNGKLDTIVSDGKTFDYDYYDTGYVKSIAYPGGLKTTYEYDNINRITNVTTTKNGSAINTFEYEYDNNGNTTKEIRNGEATLYSYDSLDRLISVTYSDGSSVNYEYDALNNMTKETFSNGDVRDYVYDDKYQLKEIKLNGEATDTFTYNETGAVTSHNDETYTYDMWDRLSAYSDGTEIYTYKYDANGIRTQKNDKQYIIDINNNVIAETDNTGEVTEEILWGHQPLARKIDSSWYYYIYNAHGDVVGLVNDAGTVVNTYEYTPWGEIHSETEAVDNPIKYAGEYYDEELDMIYLRARYYNPQIGRFTSLDIEEGEIASPLDMNRYVYCRNNPIKYVDPSGEVADWVILALYGYAQAVITSPDLQYDMQMLAHDISQGDYVSAAFDVVDILAPGISGSKMVPKFIKKYFNDVANWVGGVKIKNIEDLISAKSLTSNHSKGARWIPNNLKESLAMETVLSNPSGKTVVGRSFMKDSRWLGSDGWVKKAQNVNGVEIHYNYNELTGKFDDFKFK